MDGFVRYEEMETFYITNLNTVPTGGALLDTTVHTYLGTYLPNKVINKEKTKVITSYQLPPPFLFIFLFFSSSALRGVGLV